MAFKSLASNLVEDDTNNAYDIFLRDRNADLTERISLSSLGNQVSQDSEDPAISANGRFVAFWSLAATLVEGDTNGATDVFVRDRDSGEGTLSISGLILDEDNSPMSGVQVWTGSCLSGISTTSGAYTITGVYSGTYTINPFLVGYMFEPIARTVTVPPDVSGQDFIAVKTYTIAGTIIDEFDNPLSEVTVCTHTGICAESEANGTYTITGIISGTYTITPSKTDYTFNPENRTVNVPPDRTGQDFTGAYSNYTISGKVKDGRGYPLMGVLICTDKGVCDTSDSAGAYLIDHLTSSSYTISPSKTGFLFNPTFRTIIIPPSSTNQDFVGYNPKKLYLPLVKK